MSQSREDRMLLHYRSLKKSQDYRSGPNLVWMTLARTWRMPIREVREIIELEREKTRVDEKRGITRCSADAGWHVYKAGPCFRTLAEAQAYRESLDAEGVTWRFRP